jgi:hypothetical protein
MNKFAPFLSPRLLRILEFFFHGFMKNGGHIHIKYPFKEIKFWASRNSGFRDKSNYMWIISDGGRHKLRDKEILKYGKYII